MLGLMMLCSAFLMAAWVVFVNILGFLVSGIVFFSLITIYLEGKDLTAGKLFKHLGIVWGLVIFFYLFFAKLLWVPFPRGILL
jgi:hypothetical protein